MRVAFYAPLKPPDHPVPSGDRRIARLLFEALRLAGHEPFVASRLRSYDGIGDPERQAQLAAMGGHEAARLLRAWRQAPGNAPQLWFTYHLYYKAPDWLGPPVCEALGIPYIIAEGSFAPKRSNGPWAIGHAAVAAALAQADTVLGLNAADHDALVPLLRDAGCWIAFPPFLDASANRARQESRAAAPRLIAVAMMRKGDKLASFRLLGAALEGLLDLSWSLDIVGDGPARPEVEAALAPLGARVRFRGELAEDAVREALAEADLFVWPAVNEAVGMALLEAQAAGLPVVAGAIGGVTAIVKDRVTGLLTSPADAEAFAAATRRLILDPDARAMMGAAAQAKARAEHDRSRAAQRLAAVIDRLPRRRAA
jgi:glycosyltransferase involved in cell wall biosynthesis